MLAGLGAATACGYPDFRFVPGVNGNGGDAGTGGTAAGAGGTTGAAASGGAGTGGTTTGGTSGDAGDGGAGTEAGAGGAGGAGGQGGSPDECDEGEGGGGAVVPYTCADYEFVPTECTCHDNDGHAYFFCNAYRSFENASLYCGFDGMKLVRIDDSQENGWIQETAAAQSPRIEYYWIGGTAEDTPNSWRWVDGTPFWEGPVAGAPVCGRFVGWRSTAPTDAAVTEPVQDCLHFTLDGWDDVPCAEARMYVCEWY